jgi:hypothetical protein
MEKCFEPRAQVRNSRRVVAVVKNAYYQGRKHADL